MSFHIAHVARRFKGARTDLAVVWLVKAHVLGAQNHLHGSDINAVG